jgi:hypothetical protein
VANLAHRACRTGAGEHRRAAADFAAADFAAAGFGAARSAAGTAATGFV